MHIVLVSSCEKRAWKRTRSILDSYAQRSGERTWITPITEEGLGEIKKLLRQSATRQTSVACFRNDGRKRMRLLWVVGNKNHFNKEGISPVAVQAKKEKNSFPDWIKDCQTIAGAAGFMHDLGKFGKTFQEKLRARLPQADPVRHEWISMMLVQEILKEGSFEKAWKRIEEYKLKDYQQMGPFNEKLATAVDTLGYLIATHHRLPIVEGIRMLGAGNHVQETDHKTKMVSLPSEKNQIAILKKLEKVKSISPPITADSVEAHANTTYWQAVALISRVALILADHAVSSETHLHENSLGESACYANTDRETGRLNQNLDWHLETVGAESSEMLYRMFNLSPPSLSRESVERITSHSQGRFSWQNAASSALAASVEANNLPHLVFNLAGTGSGKTRMNAKAICALSTDNDIRFHVGLNLRSLTLQTGDVYASEIGVPKDEMACLVGDHLVRQLHEYQKSLSERKNSRKSEATEKEEDLLVDDDENLYESEFEVMEDFVYTEMPDWLNKFARNKPYTSTVIGAPVLISTIDFVISAGDPTKQGNHALAFLRVMTSDLILDEIDGYEPMQLLSVLRLVMISALFKRNVVVSSATLSRPVANLVWRAYRRGSEMRGKLEKTDAGFVTAFIHDTAPSVANKCPSIDQFKNLYEDFLKDMLKNLEGQRLRVPILQPVVDEKIRTSIRSAIEVLDANHSQQDPVTGKKLSIGLVRTANIKFAIEVSRFLSVNLFKEQRDTKTIMIACYHSQLFPIHRWHIEKRLDELLSRKKGDAHIFNDPEIRQILDRNNSSDLVLIVVATPVEEIGRDHDFDWAVIEPSSAQSIVQVAGRVNRHRLKSVEKANIAILQFNKRYVDRNRPVFSMPGLEFHENPYPDHDLAKILDFNLLEKSQIDARLRFHTDKHLFSKYDDESIEKETEKDFTDMIGESSNLWMGQDLYRKTVLREWNQRMELKLIDSSEPDKFMCKIEGTKEMESSRTLQKCTSIDPNAWLSVSDSVLESMAHDAGVDRDNAMTASVIGRDTLKIARDVSFGFYNSTA